MRYLLTYLSFWVSTALQYMTNCIIRDTLHLDLQFNHVDVAFVLGSFCLGLGLEGCCLVDNTAVGSSSCVCT